MRATPQQIGILAGLAAGFLAYKAQPKISCPGVPGASEGQQTLWDALKGAASHTLEDFAEGGLAIQDWITAKVSDGTLTPDNAATFYSWWNGLSPEQQQLAIQAEDSGLVDCAARETANQIAGGLSALVTGAIVGLLAYAIAPSFVKG